MKTITELKDNEVFVFGSNLSGIHGRGAAKTAYTFFGAKWKQASGLQGKSYAIPTKNKEITAPLTIEEIKPFVDEFVSFAKSNPQLTFLVTKVGCGLAEYRPIQIAPLFKKCINLSNVVLPDSFSNEIVVRLKHISQLKIGDMVKVHIPYVKTILVRVSFIDLENWFVFAGDNDDDVDEESLPLYPNKEGFYKI